MPRSIVRSPFSFRRTANLAKALGDRALGAILLGVVVLGVAAPPSHAAEPAPAPPPSPTSIDAVVDDVLNHNPELGFYVAEIDAARGESRNAGAWRNPEFSSSVGQKRVTSGGLSGEGLAWAVSLQQTFDWPGRIPLRKAIANGQLQLAELGLAQFKASLASRARALAYVLFAAQERAAAAGEVANRFQQLREMLVQRDPAGLTPLLETRIIEATELVLQRKSTEATLASQSALLELNQLRGQPWESPVSMKPVALQFAPPPEEEVLLTAARKNNFELQIRRVELEQQGFKVNLARKDGYPSLTVGPYYSQEHAGDKERQIGIGLSVPLPLWDRNQGNVEAAEARRRQAATTLQVAQRDLDRRILETALRYKTKLVEIGKWRPDSADEFRKAAELADRHYRLGAVPIATYVELQKQYLEAIDALLETRLEALEAGQQLQQLTGLDLHAVLTTFDRSANR